MTFGSNTKTVPETGTLTGIFDSKKQSLLEQVLSLTPESIAMVFDRPISDGQQATAIAIKSMEISTHPFEATMSRAFELVFVVSIGELAS